MTTKATYTGICVDGPMAGKELTHTSGYYETYTNITPVSLRTVAPQVFMYQHHKLADQVGVWLPLHIGDPTTFALKELLASYVAKINGRK